MLGRATDWGIHPASYRKIRSQEPLKSTVTMPLWVQGNTNYSGFGALVALIWVVVEGFQRSILNCPIQRANLTPLELAG